MSSMVSSNPCPLLCNQTRSPSLANCPYTGNWKTQVWSVPPLSFRRRCARLSGPPPTIHNPLPAGHALQSPSANLILRLRWCTCFPSFRLSLSAVCLSSPFFNLLRIFSVTSGKFCMHSLPLVISLRAYQFGDAYSHSDMHLGSRRICIPGRALDH